MQTAVVALIVVACALRAAWLLAPAAARRSIARALLARRLPRVLAARLHKHAQAVNAEACACDGCDNRSDAAAAKSAPTVAPITFHRRSPR